MLRTSAPLIGALGCFMPLRVIGKFVLQPVIELAIQFAGYIIGRVVVPVLTLGRVQIEHGPKGVRTTPKWHGFNK